MTPSLRLHPALSHASRLRGLRLAGSRQLANESMVGLEWLALMSVGAMTALLSTFVDLHVRIPGHAILKVVFPVAAGMALVPRQYAGSVIGASALMTAIPLRVAGFSGEGLGFGALTSLTLMGPMLDVILKQARSGKAVYLGFVVAGLATNLIALAVRGGMKWMGWERAGGRPLSIWLSQASVTYVICGLAAGAFSALVWFSLGDHQTTPPTEAES